MVNEHKTRDLRCLLLLSSSFITSFLGLDWKKTIRGKAGVDETDVKIQKSDNLFLQSNTIFRQRRRHDRPRPTKKHFPILSSSFVEYFNSVCIDIKKTFVLHCSYFHLCYRLILIPFFLPRNCVCWAVYVLTSCQPTFFVINLCLNIEHIILFSFICSWSNNKTKAAIVLIK